MLLLRGETRRSELAVRRALGASRTATVRQFFLESLALGLGASGVGLLVAHWSLPGLLARAPDQLPRVEWVGIDATVVFFAAVMTLVTTGVAALAPALAVGGNAMSELRGAGRGVTGSVTRRGRHILVVAQVALAVMIVAAAGVVIQSLLRLQQVETGVADDRLVFVELALTTPEYTDAVRRAQFFDHLALSLEAAPGISPVTAVNTLPFSAEQGWDVPSFSVEGQTVERAAENPSLNLESVDPSYFETFGVPLRNGRSFTEDDREDTPLVAIVSEDVAALTWPNQDPVGKRLKPGPPDSPNPWRTVVAVAASTRYRDLSKDRPTLYLPAAQFLDTAWLLVLQTTEPVAHVATLSRDRVQAIDPDVAVMRVVPFGEMFDIPPAHPRFHAFLLAVFGTTALGLATIGLYAVVAAFVRQRDTEIGVRMALGATTSHIGRLVVGEGLWLGGVGAVIGLVGAIVSTRILGTRLFDLPAAEPLLLAGSAAILVTTSLIASYLPTRRATRVDPARLLRSE